VIQFQEPVWNPKAPTNSPPPYERISLVFCLAYRTAKQLVLRVCQSVTWYGKGDAAARSEGNLPERTLRSGVLANKARRPHQPPPPYERIALVFYLAYGTAKQLVLRVCQSVTWYGKGDEAARSEGNLPERTLRSVATVNSPRSARENNHEGHQIRIAKVSASE